MGLLDDAIREHLELKRQHGGDPSEIERQEHEAFGPGGRPVATSAAEAPPEDAALEPGDEAEEQAPPEVVDDATRVMPAPPTEEHEGPAPEPDAPLDEVPSREVPADEVVADETAREEDPWLADDADDAAVREAEQEAEEDVLEETPEFLQETPEHDRLWFEQKPPRDFDWDK
jgi:hypothetical protein